MYVSFCKRYSASKCATFGLNEASIGGTEGCLQEVRNSHIRRVSTVRQHGPDAGTSPPS